LFYTNFKKEGGRNSKNVQMKKEGKRKKKGREGE